ncbi:general transcription factor 3C polypeptide 6-like [Ciona intestinalis]
MDVSSSNAEESTLDQTAEMSEDINTEEDLDPQEWELVEDEYVVLNLLGLISEEFLKTCDSSRVKVIGLLDSEEPVFQLDRFVFVGKREKASGTCVLFKVDKEEEPSTSEEEESSIFRKPEEDSENVGIKYFCCTEKTLVMNQAFLSNKND